MTKYVTLENDAGGVDYRAIAVQMGHEGYHMGHSTVRNIILRAMEKFAVAIMAVYDAEGDPSEVARNPDFQRGIASLVEEAILMKKI